MNLIKGFLYFKESLPFGFQTWKQNSLTDISQSAYPGGQFCSKVKVSVTQACLTLCNPVDCGPPGSSVHGILQTRILEWVAIPFSRDLPDLGTEPGSPTLQADSLLSEPLALKKVQIFTNVDTSPCLKDSAKTNPNTQIHTGKTCVFSVAAFVPI